MQHLITILLVALAAIISPALAARSALRAPGHLLQGRSFLCPVVCDDTWCCEIGQTCQEANEGNVPYECADPLLETTAPAFALEPLSSMVESILTDASAFISSLASEFSLTLTPSSITSLPDPFEETTVSERPVVSETSKLVSITSNSDMTTQEKTSSATSIAIATSEIEPSEGPSKTSTERRTTPKETSSTTSTSTAETLVTEPSKPPVETSTLISTPETSEARTTPEESNRVTSTAPFSQETSLSSETITTAASEDAAPTPRPQWQQGIAVAGLAMAMIV